MDDVLDSPVQVENGETFLQVDCDDNKPYEKKYFALLKRCENIQQSNERIVNRIHHVKKLLKKMRYERRALMRRLDKHGDNYQNIPITLPTEEDLITPLSNQPLAYNSPPNNSLMSSVISQPLETVGLLPTVDNTTGASGSGHKKKSRNTEKDVNLPKKPSKPFFLFCQEQRPTALEQYFVDNQEEPSRQELTRILAKNWNSMSAEEKKVYYNLYEQEKEHYEQEINAYNAKKSTNPDLAGGSNQETSSNDTL